MTTVQQVQAGIAYRALQRQIYRELDQVKSLMHQHQMAAAAEGTTWERVGDLRDVLALLQRITTPHASSPTAGQGR